MNDDSKIVKFDPDRAPLSIRSTKFCRHKYIIVCEKSRTLECDTCGAAIDPFDFMLKWAKEDRSLEYRMKQLKDELKRLGEKLGKLRRMEKNVRARLGRARAKERDDS
jgi:hypothetical protein